MTKEEIEVIHKQAENGGKAKIALEVLKSVIHDIIEDSKDEFSKIPLANYQNIDNNKIYVLLSRIEVSRLILLEIRRRIDDGERAQKLINGE